MTEKKQPQSQPTDKLRDILNAVAAAEAKGTPSSAMLSFPIATSTGPVLLDIVNGEPQYGYRKSPAYRVRLQMLDRTKKILQEAGIDVDDLMGERPSYATTTKFMELLKQRQAATPHAGAMAYMRHLLGETAQKAVEAPLTMVYREDETIIDIYPPEAAPAERKPPNRMPQMKPVEGLGRKFAQDVFNARKHTNYRAMLQGAYRSLHPRRDSYGRVMPVRAYGESELRYSRRPTRNAAMERALRVVKYREQVQRLRAEQNKKHLKKAKRHRKAWQ